MNIFRTFSNFWKKFLISLEIFLNVWKLFWICLEIFPNVWNFFWICLEIFPSFWKRFLTGLELFPSLGKNSKWIWKLFYATASWPPFLLPPPPLPPHPTWLYCTPLLALEMLHNVQYKIHLHMYSEYTIATPALSSKSPAYTVCHPHRLTIPRSSMYFVFTI